MNSCKDYAACFYFGLYSSGTAATKHIRDSCNNNMACDSVAYKGSIGNVTTSCNAKYACTLAGSPAPNGTGTISTVLNSCCNTYNECKRKNGDTIPALCFSTTQVRWILCLLGTRIFSSSLFMCSFMFDANSKRPSMKPTTAKPATAKPTTAKPSTAKPTTKPN